MLFLRRRRLPEESGARWLASLLCAVVAALGGCTVGPKYVRPAAEIPSTYKEAGKWKTAEPGDALLKGNWWEVFGDPELNAQERKIAVSNQDLKAAQARFLEARAALRLTRSGLFPQVSAGTSITRERQSSNRPFASTTTANKSTSDFVLSGDASYEADVWGRVRRTVEASRAQAQASAADLESVNLSLHAELALDYFQLRGLDAEKRLLDSTVSSFEKALELTQSRFAGGVASREDVEQAATQLESTRALAIDVRVQRAAFEHAIGSLTGEPASTFNLAPLPLATPPPAIPPGLPSQLLERRPDVASAERLVVAANAQIGVAKAAYYPLILLGITGGFESTSPATWLTGPSTLWSAGASAAETAFDAGRRRAISEQARATYDETVANYRQTVLNAFQEVEDNLSALSILSDEAKTEDSAVAAAQRSLDQATNRYKGGVDTYLTVITAQNAALADQRAAVDILTRRLTASVLLIKALGGGWNASSLPALTTAGPAPNSR